MREMVSRGHAFGPTASVADTKTTIGTAYKVPKGGTIKKIRYSMYQGVVDKATSGVLYLESDQQKGPFEFAVGGSAGIAGSDVGYIPTEVIDVDIPVVDQEEITISIKSAEALEENTISIEWE